ncbi:MAG TPA: RNA pseudouridine synthase, partial [Campylobacter avium]|nr:RNA pseudouridine synthase [Campylobacter avium]
AKIPSQRMYLHSFECAIFDYRFRADLDESFEKFGFELKNLNFKDL